MQLATRFGRGSTALRARDPLTDDQMRRVAPSIFAAEAHESRSHRYTFIPTIDVLNALRKEGFQPFMVTQARTRIPGKQDFTKHMIRLRNMSGFHAQVGQEVNEIVLLNSHDGSSSYQMMPGVFRVVCTNGLVSGRSHDDIRVRHGGDVIDNVIEGAFRVVEDFERIADQRDSMKALSLNEGERGAFANAALSLKYDTEAGPAPVTESQILRARRMDDAKLDMWSTLNVVQENMIKGGLRGRTGKTREVKGIDQDVKLNRALWALAEEMRKLKA